MEQISDEKPLLVRDLCRAIRLGRLRASGPLGPPHQRQVHVRALLSPSPPTQNARQSVHWNSRSETASSRTRAQSIPHRLIWTSCVESEKGR